MIPIGYFDICDLDPALQLHGGISHGQKTLNANVKGKVQKNAQNKDNQLIKLISQRKVLCSCGNVWDQLWKE